MPYGAEYIQVLIAINRGMDMGTKKGTNNGEKLSGTDSNDILLGRGGTLIGGTGNDRLVGGDGADELMGGDGNDPLLPGKGGADAIDGGKGIDTVSYANFVPTLATHGISVQPNYVGQNTYADATGDTFQNVERFIGTSGDDVFYFYRNDVAQGYQVNGGDGDDFLRVEGGVMRGGHGADELRGDSNDALVDRFWLELGRGADEILGFDYYQDKLRISSKDFDIGKRLNDDELVHRASNNEANAAKAQFIYRSDEKQLFYDVDGTGDAAAVLVADFGTDGSNSLNVALFKVVASSSKRDQYLLERHAAHIRHLEYLAGAKRSEIVEPFEAIHVECTEAGRAEF